MVVASMPESIAHICVIVQCKSIFGSALHALISGGAVYLAGTSCEIA